MTLLEMKNKVFKLIEESSADKTKLTDDEDFNKKINDVIYQIMLELIRYKKLPAYETMQVKKDEEINLQEDLDNFLQLNKIVGIKFDIEDVFVTFKEDGEAKIYYYKLPKKINEDTEDEDYKFEDILKSDVSNEYGSIYANRYRELLQGLDPRYSNVSIEIVDGVDF